MATWSEEDGNEGHVFAALSENGRSWVALRRMGLLDKTSHKGFSFRAAQVSGTRGFLAVHEPGSRDDFMQALRQLGAEPKIEHLQSTRKACRMMRIHVSCSHAEWLKVFGEPECVEEIAIPSTTCALHLWKHFCSDGPVTCIGHLFERSPGVRQVVVMRVTCL